MTPGEGKMFCLFGLFALYIGLNLKKKKKFYIKGHLDLQSRNPYFVLNMCFINA